MFKSVSDHKTRLLGGKEAINLSLLYGSDVTQTRTRWSAEALLSSDPVHFVIRPESLHASV